MKSTTEPRAAEQPVANAADCSDVFADLCRRIRAQVATMAPHQKERLTGTLLIEADYALRKLQDGLPVIDRLQWELEHGSYIKQQDGLWHLFAKTGDGIACGDTLRKMLFELVFVD